VAGFADDKRTGTHPPRICVVKNDNLVIARQAHVAFDTRPGFERSGERNQAVLGTLRTAVQPTMRKALWAGIERVRP
jgi:hypothetical protein